MLSLLRTETFLLRSVPHILQSAHVGCAGLQDRPDVFLYLFHWLERESVRAPLPLHQTHVHRFDRRFFCRVLFRTCSSSWR